MKQTRKRIFETNSSSTHSLTYSRDDVQGKIGYLFKDIANSCDELAKLFFALEEMDAQHSDTITIEEDY